MKVAYFFGATLYIWGEGLNERVGAGSATMSSCVGEFAAEEAYCRRNSRHREQSVIGK